MWHVFNPDSGGGPVPAQRPQAGIDSPTVQIAGLWAGKIGGEVWLLPTCSKSIATPFCRSWKQKAKLERRKKRFQVFVLFSMQGHGMELREGTLMGMLKSPCVCVFLWSTLTWNLSIWRTLQKRGRITMLLSLAYGFLQESDLTILQWHFPPEEKRGSVRYIPEIPNSRSKTRIWTVGKPRSTDWKVCMS